MNVDLLVALENNIEALFNRIKNQSVRDFVLKNGINEGQILSFEKLIKFASKNVSSIKYYFDEHKINKLNSTILQFLENTKNQTNINFYIVEIIDSINLFSKYITEFMKLKIEDNDVEHISKSEFQERYKKLINCLKRQNEQSNLILYTSKDNKPFKLYKNNDTLIILPSTANNYLSITKDQLTKIAFGEKESNLASYTPSIISKIIDNTIFDEIKNDDIIDSFILNSNEHKIELLEEDKNKLYGEIKQLEDKFNEQKELFEKVSLMYEKSSSLEEDYANAKETVLNDIKVQESYKYWEEQIVFYSKRYLNYLKIAILSSLVLLSCIFFIDKKFAIEAKAEIVKEVKNVDLKDKKLDEVKNSVLGIDFIKYGFMILLISLAIWLIRIVMKIALSSYHLSIDAKERVIMIKTYLSLMKEGNAVSENDKKIMIESIFRTTNHGIVKDESSVTVTDIISSFKK